MLGVGQRFDGVLPCPRGDPVVRASEIRLGDLQIEQRLAFGVVLGFDDLLRFILAVGVEADALAGGGVLAIELSAPAVPAN